MLDLRSRQHRVRLALTSSTMRRMSSPSPPETVRPSIHWLAPASLLSAPSFHLLALRSASPLLRSLRPIHSIFFFLSFQSFYRCILRLPGATDRRLEWLPHGPASHSQHCFSRSPTALFNMHSFLQAPSSTLHYTSSYCISTLFALTEQSASFINYELCCCKESFCFPSLQWT